MNYINDDVNYEEIFSKIENETTFKVYNLETIQEKLNTRFNDDPRDNVATVAKENLLTLPFKGKPHPDYPSPWLTVSMGEFGDLVKATAYVIKKRFDLAPLTRVGLIANATPHYQLISYALWYNRCTVVIISPKLGNDVKQFWARLLDIKMMFYDANLHIYDKEIQAALDEGGEWIWPWEYPLTEEEQGLSAGIKGIPMFSVYQKDFCEEIYQSMLEGKSYQREGHKDDVVVIAGTSSSTQAIIKNGQCSKMKFVPYLTYNNGIALQNTIFNRTKKYYSSFVNVPFFFSMGNVWLTTYTYTTGGPLIYHTQQLDDIGYVPEHLLQDLMETNPDNVLLFPFHYAEIKKLFDEHHPKCSIWREFIKSRGKYTFRVTGAPLSDTLAQWFREEFNQTIINLYGSSEEMIPGEKGYLTKIPWNIVYLKPLNENDPNIGELYSYSPSAITGYIKKSEKGEFYDSPMHGYRIDAEADQLFTFINGTIVQECKDISHCCLLLDDTQNNVVCFVEPVWSEIIMEDGNPFDITISSETISKEQIKKVRKIAQKQIWNSIYSVLEDDSKSLNTWTKQLTINNIVIIDYGKKFPVTGKGSLARRVARLEYSHVLEKISKLISGEINEIDDEVEKEETDAQEMKEPQEKSQQTTYTDKEVNENNIHEPADNKASIKTHQEITEEIEKAIKIVYESIKEIIPSTPEFENFNIHAPFTLYSIDSLGVYHRI
ncbi:hypothetical protein PIROE2DRAFT_62973 [Piromyces sp. E2]|nr:hypothetical protein PIROE2DRAFT_62973 [Piromyces sp. E2]|eukprot:OUM60726.1 hypothetical protein PIROE2DRAFT_62973 [Piromyces sp. E2]